MSHRTDCICTTCRVLRERVPLAMTPRSVNLYGLAGSPATLGGAMARSLIRHTIGYRENRGVSEREVQSVFNAWEAMINER